MVLRKFTRRVLVLVVAALLLAALGVLWVGRSRAPLVSAEGKWQKTNVTCFDDTLLRSYTNTDSTASMAKRRGENVVAVPDKQLGKSFQLGDMVEVNVNGKTFQGVVRDSCAQGQYDCEKNKDSRGNLVDVHIDAIRNERLMSREDIIASYESKYGACGPFNVQKGKVRKLNKTAQWSCDIDDSKGCENRGRGKKDGKKGKKDGKKDGKRKNRRSKK